MCIHTCNFFVHGECNTREFYQGVLCLLEALSKDHSGSGFLPFSWKLCAERKFRALLGSQSTDPAKALDTREGKVNLHLCDLTTSTPLKELLRLHVHRCFQMPQHRVWAEGQILGCEQGWPQIHACGEHLVLFHFVGRKKAELALVKSHSSATSVLFGF